MRQELIRFFEKQKENAVKTLEIYFKTAEEKDIELLLPEAVELVNKIRQSEEALRYLDILPAEGK